MRPRFGIQGGEPSNNSILASLQRSGHQARLKEEYQKTRQLRDGQKHLWDTNIKPQEFNAISDDSEIAGITELGVLRNGRVDESITGNVVIGGREHPMDKGKVRIISKQAIDDSIIPILEERSFKDAVISAILADRSGKVCRMMLSNDRYNLLKGGNNQITQISQNIPQDIIDADARPEFFTFFHESSKEWALATQKLSIVVDNTPLVYDGEIMDWLNMYGGVKKSNPVSN